MDAAFADVATVTPTLLATISGTVRTVVERSLPMLDERAVRGGLVVMRTGYPDAVRSTD